MLPSALTVIVGASDTYDFLTPAECFFKTFFRLPQFHDFDKRNVLDGREPVMQHLNRIMFRETVKAILRRSFTAR